MRSTRVTTGRSKVILGLAVVLMALVASAGCKAPVVAKATEPAVAGGIEFSLGEYEVRFLELTDGDKTVEYPRPVVVMPVTMKNVGSDNFIYNPTHSAQQMTEANTPLLYVDPGADAELPPSSKTPVPGVFLEKGELEGQITQATTIPAGESVTDLLLFEVPAKDVGNLVLSVPPSMHRGDVPVLFRLAYTPKEPKGPTVYDVGQPIAFDSAKFKVTRRSVEYVKTDDAAQGEGYSSDPLLKIAYEITNTGQEPLTYEPGHRNVGGRGASLYGKADTFKRVRFPGTTSVEGQQRKESKIAPGESVKDFVLFEKPNEDQTVVLEFPASSFEQSGLARVSFEVSAEAPEMPEALTKKKKEEDG